MLRSLTLRSSERLIAVEGLSKRSLFRLHRRECILFLVSLHFFKRGETILGVRRVSKVAVEVVFVLNFDLRFPVLARIVLFFI